MNKTALTLLVALLLIVISECVFGKTKHASYCDRLYIKGFSGLNATNGLKWDDGHYDCRAGIIAGGSIGYKFNLILLEGEFSYRNNSIDHITTDNIGFDLSGDLKQYCGFGNLLFNIPVTFRFSPYVGVGYGYRHLTVNFKETFDAPPARINSIKESGAYQVIGGLDFVLYKRVSLQLEYRYLDSFRTTCCNHNVDVGLTVHY